MSTTTPEYTLTVNKAGATLHWRGQTFEIERLDLEDGGWEFEPECHREHCGDGVCIPSDEAPDELGLAEQLKRWHDDESGHAGPFKFCDHEPCKGIGQALGVRLG